MAKEIITTLHPDQDPNTNLYPNIKKENIPNGSISTTKLDPDVLSMIGSLKPSGVDTSSNILSKKSNDGIWVGSDTGKWYYWDGSKYIEGGNYISNIDDPVSIDDLDSEMFEDLFVYDNFTDITSSFTLVSYYLDKANGNSNPDSNSKSTGYIDLSTYNGVFLVSGYSQYATCMICTYDENKIFLRYYCDGGSTGKTYKDYMFKPKQDEKYVKFGTYQYTSHPLVIKNGSDVLSIAKTKRNNYLKGKKYTACGDSYTKGDVISSDKVYPYLIADRNDMILVNMAQNGGYIHYGDSGFTNPNNSSYYKNIPLDSDYITIAYGLNETTTSLGSKYSNDNTTIWGAYNEVLGWIISNIPNAKVGIISNDGWMTYELRNTLQDIANYWGVDFLDLKEYGKPLLISGKYTQDGEVNSSVVTNRTNQYCVSSTNGHPNELGHKVRSYIIENFLNGETSTNTIPLSKIVDNKGNHRFIGGNGTLENVSGLTIGSSKWVLNGTNLIFEILGSFNGNLSGYDVLSTFDLPDWIINKIVTPYNNIVDIIDCKMIALDGSGITIKVQSTISGNTIYFTNLTEISISSTSIFKIRYNIIIDND